MTDAEALTEINAALDKWFRSEASEYATLNRIAYITGLNANAE